STPKGLPHRLLTSAQPTARGGTMSLGRFPLNGVGLRAGRRSCPAGRHLPGRGDVPEQDSAVLEPQRQVVAVRAEGRRHDAEAFPLGAALPFGRLHDRERATIVETQRALTVLVQCADQLHPDLAVRADGPVAAPAGAIVVAERYDVAAFVFHKR